MFFVLAAIFIIVLIFRILLSPAKEAFLAKVLVMTILALSAILYIDKLSKILLSLFVIGGLYGLVRCMPNIWGKIKNKKRAKICIAVSAVTIASVLITISTLNGIEANQIEAKNREKVQNVIYLIEYEYYDEAKKIIDLTPEDFAYNNIDYSDIQYLKKYIEAKQIYDPNDHAVLLRIQDMLRNTGAHNFDAVSAEFDMKVKNFAKQVDDQYVICHQEYIANSIPFEGMSEDDLYSTKWGRPYKVEKSIDFDHLAYYRRHKTYYYSFTENGKKKIGKVTVSYDKYKKGKVSDVYIHDAYVLPI